ncbi:class II fructose-bisphosphate aldolase [Alkalibacter saccharofermentans]|uniref:Fructose-bisphosphate aldolase n=1 Tax=Alkalibacter saccharofermentans DSM 14828 TaxID=1120975 RepID=A0A1M4U5J8_9FIRM|nr:ketose-bisphosphate aldolase [Alkalibacter saccharofermentans]SHE51958.1 fructose-bisphosphate aldolase [Alkalibacter saccharofermentans DSM 14828]
MPIVPLRPLLETSNKYGFAHGGFNVNSVAQAKAVIEVHSMFRSAAILQAADLANGFMGGKADFLNATLEDKKKGAKNIATAVKKYADQVDIPVVLHLDHGKDFESVKAAIDNGYSSVMIDGSHLEFDQNVELTREVVKYAHERGVSVEGELGILAGVEDNIFSNESTYTNPMKVCEFFKKTGVDCLAISYGTAHGPNKGKDTKIRKEIAIASKENLRHEGIFGTLVSHGSSTVPQYIVNEINDLGGNIQNAYGISIDQLKSVTKHGIGKINIDTDIRLAITRNIREYFNFNPNKKASESLKDIWSIMKAKPDAFDPRAYLTPIIDVLMYGETKDLDVIEILDCIERGVKEVAGTLIVEFGSVGYAPKIEMITLDEMAELYKKGIK